MLKIKVEFPARALAGAVDALAARSSSLGDFASEAGIPAMREDAEQTTPAEYMYYQDRGFWAGLTYVPPSPWFSGTIEGERLAWSEDYAKGAERVIAGDAKAEALALVIASQMRNDFIDGITGYDLIDTGDARRSVAFRVHTYHRQPAEWSK